jgi:hypothetical protein
LLGELSRPDKRDSAYLRGLFGLAGQLFGSAKDYTATRVMASLARSSPRELPADARLSLLKTLVDASPPQSAEFWKEILMQDPKRHAGVAFSGVLATNFTAAVQMLPGMPDAPLAGQKLALKLGLAWDVLSVADRFKLLQAVHEVLPNCRRSIADPLSNWVASKRGSESGAAVARERRAEALFADSRATPSSAAPKPSIGSRPSNPPPRERASESLF